MYLSLEIYLGNKQKRHMISAVYMKIPEMPMYKKKTEEQIYINILCTQALTPKFP